MPVINVLVGNWSKHIEVEVLSEIIKIDLKLSDINFTKPLENGSF